MNNVILNILMNIKKKYKMKQLNSYYKTNSCYLNNFLIDKSKNTLIMTVSFNNETVIKKQIELIEKFCKDSYVYIVADNSTDINKRTNIKEICINRNILYYPLPINNPFNNYDPSSSHGAALNYLWKNIVDKISHIDYIMILDHDIFPTNYFSVEEMLNNQPFYGLVKERKLGWYLWPGFCCYKKESCIGKVINFLPSEYGDTGSSNYLSLYQNFDLYKVNKATFECVDLDINKVECSDKYIDQKNRIEIIDTKWIHLINAADWAGVGNVNKKFEKMMNFINDNLKEININENNCDL